jgi:hypothetical protein
MPEVKPEPQAPLLPGVVAVALSAAYLIALLAVEKQPLVIGLLAFGIVAVLAAHYMDWLDPVSRSFAEREGMLSAYAILAACVVAAFFHDNHFVLLLFVIGLELQPSRLWVLRKSVFGLGGAQVLLITYEEFKDIRLVYAPEKQLGYFGGDEMNFRFPRYVSDISILRAYQGTDGSHGEYEASHVPVKPDHILRVSMAGVKDGDFTLVSGNPGNTNRYRESYSAEYNLRKGIPNQIEDLELQLGLKRKYAAMKPEYQVVLQSQIFGLANTLKYQKDVLAALKSTDVVAERQRREKEFRAFLETRPELKSQFGGVLDAQAAVYKNDVEANAELDSALGWLQQSDAVSYAAGLYEFSQERAKTSDRDREPQYQERNWREVRAGLLNDDPVIQPLDIDMLTIGFEKALSLDRESAKAHFVRGLLLWRPSNRFPHEAAVREYRVALSLNTNLEDAHHQIGLILFHVGLLDAGLQELRQELTINPANMMARLRIGVVLLYLAVNAQSYSHVVSQPIGTSAHFTYFANRANGRSHAISARGWAYQVSRCG